MKNNLGKKISLVMVLALMLTPLLWFQGGSDAYAATPSFREKNIEIIGDGETYQLDIKDKVSGSKYKWSSSNTKVARVSSQGMVTSVGKGKADIKCVITYPTNKKKTLTSKVTVIIPATKIEINNATEVNGAHILRLGESYNFNRDITPSNSSDKTYWSVGGGDPECIKINSSNGIVEALKPGKVILKATAARKSNEAEAAKSIIDDAIIIEVVAPSATVNSAEIIDSTVIEVKFDSPIDPSTIIGTNGSLLDSIAVSLKSNIKGVVAADPGKLVAELSNDKKTLTITSDNRFEGEYGINFTNKIKTTDGIAIDEYYKHLRYEDNKPPYVEDIILDDSGMIVTIKFNEAIDFSGLKVTNAGVLPGSGSSSTIDPVTASHISNKGNYIPSEDKRSLTINLSNIAYSDFNKILTVTIAGIKDMAGNSPENYTIPIYLRTDNTPKPQARLLTLVRSGYNTLTATFDRAIQIGGVVSISGGSSAVGVVDNKEPRKVNYIITDSDALRNGRVSVSISGWHSYNVIPGDTSSYKPQNIMVNFDVDRTSPMLLSYDFDEATGILTLTYNKEVAMVMNSGVFNATLITVNEEIRPNNNITFTRVASEDPKVVKAQLSNMTFFGNYTFTIDKNFIMDNFRNNSIERTITISNTSGADLELPGPYSISQSTSNPSQIYLEFANRLDVASAQDVRNYSIPGVAILSAQVVKNTNESGATVVLTVAEGSIDITIDRPIKISGVASYSGTYTPISNFETVVPLKDNKKPYYIAPPIFDKSKTNEIRLRFSEEITGSMTVKVTQTVGTYSYELGNNVTVSGSEVIITLDSIPSNNTFLRIDILENKIVDISGNQVAPMNSQLGVVVQY